MGILQVALDAAKDGFADVYYTSTRPMWSIAGVNVDAEGAMRIAAVFACRRILAETVGSLPCITYRRLPNGGKERATDHPLYDVLHDSPNEDHSAVEWFELMTGWAAIRGSAYSEIEAGRRGPVDQLIPIHPLSITTERVRIASGFKLRYRIREKDGDRFVQPDDLLRLRGFSDNGIIGLAVGDLGRDTFGTALAAERHAARSFIQTPRPAGSLNLPVGQRLGDEAFERLQKELESHAASGANRALILEDGATYSKFGMTNEEAEFLALREFSIPEICRWFRIPPHMVYDLRRATFSNIEHQSLEFVIYTMLPWFRRWEQAISRDLIIARQTYFAEFLVSGLLRGNTAERFAAYAVGRQWGWLSVNDVRRLENMNPIAGGDTYLTPLNMVPATSGVSGWSVIDGDTGRVLQIEPESSGGRLLQLLASDAAAKVVRKEVAAMRRLAERATNGDWEAGVRTFYDDHATFVAQTAHIDIADAKRWADQQRDALLTDGPSALDEWETTRTHDLLSMTLGVSETFDGKAGSQA